MCPWELKMVCLRLRNGLERSENSQAVSKGNISRSSAKYWRVFEAARINRFSTLTTKHSLTLSFPSIENPLPSCFYSYLADKNRMTSRQKNPQPLQSWNLWHKNVQVTHRSDSTPASLCYFNTDKADELVDTAVLIMKQQVPRPFKSCYSHCQCSANYSHKCTGNLGSSW